MKRLIVTGLGATLALLLWAAPAGAQEDNDVVDVDSNAEVLNDPQLFEDVLEAQNFDDVFNLDRLFG